MKARVCGRLALSREEIQKDDNRISRLCDFSLMKMYIGYKIYFPSFHPTLGFDNYTLSIRKKRHTHMHENYDTYHHLLFSFFNLFFSFFSRFFSFFLSFFSRFFSFFFLFLSASPSESSSPSLDLSVTTETKEGRQH